MISVTDDDGPLQVGKVDGVVPIAANAAFPAVESNSRVEAGLILKTLEGFTARKGWTADVGANLKSTLDVKTSYGGQIKLVTSEGQPEVAAIVWFKAKGYKPEPRTSYYLIREAIQATELSYEIKRGDFGKLGGNATVKEVSGAFNLVDAASNDSYKLSTKSAVPLNVCIKPKKLVAKGLSSTGQLILDFEDVTGPIVSAQ